MIADPQVKQLRVGDVRAHLCGNDYIIWSIEPVDLFGEELLYVRSYCVHIDPPNGVWLEELREVFPPDERVCVRAESRGV